MTAIARRPSSRGRHVARALLGTTCALLAAGCSGDDYEAAPVDIVFYQSSDAQQGAVERDAADEPEDIVMTDLGDDASEPDTAPPTPDIPPVDTGWEPPWVENNDPTVESCLKTFPSICGKLQECGAMDDFIAGFLGDNCPEFFDGNSDALVGVCEGVANGINEQAGSFVGTALTDFLRGCVENYDCDPESLQKFGDAFSQLGAVFGDGGSGDFTDALPVLFDLADMCGGLGDLLPF